MKVKNFKMRKKDKSEEFQILMTDNTLFRTDKEVSINEYAGHMLRTKLSSVNEGGVAAGLGALDSVFLFDSN